MGNPGTHGEAASAGVDLRPLDGFPQGLGHLQGTSAAVVEHYGELVAAEKAGAEIGRPRGTLDKLTDQAQRLVAVRMTDQPVEVGETVDVTQDERELLARFLGAG